MTAVVRGSILLITAVVVSASSSSAQSLAELAKKEEARRSSVQKPSKALTNADLAADPIGTSPTAVAVDVAAAPAPAPDPASAASETTPASLTKPALDEAYWRGKGADLRAKRATAKQYVESLSRANHADPREQARTEALMKKRQAVLKRAEDAYSLFEMQADVARVPKEWIQ